MTFIVGRGIRFFRGLLALMALACWPPAHGTIADPKDTLVGPGQMAGVWLIDPQPYDAFLRLGWFTGSFPTIVIDADGFFRAYLVGTKCDWFNAQFVTDYRDKEIEISCLNALPIRQRDLANAPAVFITEGSIAPGLLGQWHFVQKDGGASLRRIIEKARAKETARFEAEKLKMFEYLFATPIDSGRLSFTLVAGMGRLSSTYNFSRYSKQTLSDAAATTLALFVATGRYFRCVLAAFSDPAGKSSSFLEELDHLRGVVKREAAMTDAYDVATIKQLKAYEIQRSTGEEKTDEVSKLMFESGQEQELAELDFPSIHESLVVTPAAKAAEAGSLGAYLGCPEIDRNQKAIREKVEKLIREAK